MPTLSRLKLFYLLYLSRPQSDRRIYRTIRRRALDAQWRAKRAPPAACQRPPSSLSADRNASKGSYRILELGVGQLVRAERTIRLAATYHAGKEIRYSGIDLFEMRSGAAVAPLALKTAYCRLKTTAARVQLLPGEPLSTFVHMANHLGRVDLVVISAPENPAELDRVWSYLPRVVHERSLIFVESRDADGQISLRQFSQKQVVAKADKLSVRRRAA